MWSAFDYLYIADGYRGAGRASRGREWYDAQESNDGRECEGAAREEAECRLKTVECVMHIEETNRDQL